MPRAGFSDGNTAGSLRCLHLGFQEGLGTAQGSRGTQGRGCGQSGMTEKVLSEDPQNSVSDGTPRCSGRDNWPCTGEIHGVVAASGKSQTMGGTWGEDAEKGQEVRVT